MHLKNCASKWALLGSVSVIAALAATSPAQAECTTSEDVVTCTGENSPFTVASDTPVIIAEGATVTGAGVTAVRLDSERANLRIDGTISATGATGLLVQNGTRELLLDPNAGARALHPYQYPYYFPTARPTIVIGEQGKISGDAGILLARSGSNYLGPLYAAVENNGLITATSGPAIRGPVGEEVYYSYIDNKASGTIHGIAAGVSAIDNAGLIDGRNEAAIIYTARKDLLYGSWVNSSLTNSGTITSASAVTIVNQQENLSLTNSGIITNSGAGFSIDAGKSLSLVNSGTIYGNIIARAYSVIDSTKGMINGNILLGDGDDLIVAAIGDNGDLVIGINGEIDGGTGVNAISLAVSTDIIWGGAPVLPTTFSRLNIGLADDALLTLSSAFKGSSLISLSGTGTLLNQGQIETQGRSIRAAGRGDTVDDNLINEGTIKANLSSPTEAAVTIDRIVFVNKNSVEATGGAGVLLTPWSNTKLTNSGTISTTGAAAVLFVNGYASNRMVENEAGGVIRGDTVAIALLPDSFFDSYDYGTTRITNAGSIIGHVDLTAAKSADRFVAQQGGSVVGDVRLGAGDDSYIMAGLMEAKGFLTGVSGMLDGGEGHDQLLARLDEDATFTLGNYSNFEFVGLDIAAGKTANISGSSDGAQLTLYGKGSADLTLSISSQNRSLINASVYGLDFPGDFNSSSAYTGTTIVSRGALNASFDGFGYGYGYGSSDAVLLDWLDRFTNEGSITLHRTVNSNNSRSAAISGGLEVVNNGEILLDGGVAISGALKVVNSGTISQIADGASAIGISGVDDLINSGTISTSGIAVADSNTIINSGTIQSEAAQAILGYSSPTIANQAGGVIAGGDGFDAIALSHGGAVSNSGTINGNVNFAYSPYGGTSYGDGAYVDRGGTLAGNLLFGSGNDIFVATKDMLGVLGTIDAGSGMDSFLRAYDMSRTVDLGALPALPDSFERHGVGAFGSETVITLTSETSSNQPLTLVGDGTIINLADIDASSASNEKALTLGSSSDPTNLIGAGSTLTFVNRGTTGAISGFVARFENEGTIAPALNGSGTLQLFASSTDTFAFKNSGTFRSAPEPNTPFYYYVPGIEISNASDTQIIGQASVANSGTVDGGMTVSLHAKEFSFSNDGSISSRATPTSVVLMLGQTYSYGDPDLNSDQVTIGNSGTLAQGLSATVGAKALTFTNSGAINSSRYSDALKLAQSAHRTGDSTQGYYGDIDQESFSFANSGTIDGSAFLESQSATTALANSGQINSLALKGDSLGSQSVAIANSGRIGADALGVSAVSIRSSARSADDRRYGLESGSEPVEGSPTMTITFTNSGMLSADGGARYSPASEPPFPWYPPVPVSLKSVTALYIAGSSSGLSSIMVTNEADGLISAIGATRTADPEQPLAAGLDTVGSTAFFGTANQITLVNAGTIRGLAGGILPTTLTNGTPDQFMAGAIQTFDSTDTVTNLASGVISGSIDLGTRDDQMANYGIIDGSVALGAGDDRFTRGLRAIQVGQVDGGAGTDALIIDITGGGLLNEAIFEPFVSFEAQSITGVGTIMTDGPLSLDSLILQDAQLTLGAGQRLETASDTSIVFAEGTNRLTNEGTIVGGLRFAGGSNSVVNLGSIAGPVMLDGGSNSFTVGANSSVAGPVMANSGDDLLILTPNGTDAAPQELRLAAFTGFERARQDSGTLALSGDFTTGELTVAGGRFIGRTGSVLDVPSILVNQGATFGSAGMVNGDVTVQGTLSPGSSPGTMTVNGNVALAGSSTTLFEMTSTVSDALVINGGLTIASGATLKITGNRPLTPGVNYALITTTNGIVGRFDSIDKAAAVVGFVRQGDRSIDLLGQFVLGSGASGQVIQTVDYLNSLLIAGTATNGMLAAAPSLLLKDGTVNQIVVGRLNAESYASASQIGIENGLVIASALRTASTSMQGEEPGLFTFGQALGGWRGLPGNVALGTSRANISTYGALAGIGFGTQSASIGAFVGYVDARQQIAGLQARTDANGMLAGVMARGTAGGFQIAASLSYDGSKADTERSLFGGSKVDSHYRLRSWTADLSLGHAFAVSKDWTLAPQVGVTHISSRRGSASETGDAVWALDVDARRTKASFLRGELALRASPQAQISPWLSAGVLHLLSGSRTFATGAYEGVADGLTVEGVGRSKTLATVGAGANLKVSPTATLFFGANSEFGAESNGQSANVGFRLRF